MADVSETLPREIEAAAVKRWFYATEIVRGDGGGQFTNQRWEDPLAEWDITYPNLLPGDDDYLQVKAWFEAVKGSALTFTFHDFEACEDVEVRLKDDTISFQGVGNMVSISMTLEQARG